MRIRGYKVYGIIKFKKIQLLLNMENKMELWDKLWNIELIVLILLFVSFEIMVWGL